MGRVLTISLTSEQETELIHHHKKRDNHVLRQRCQIILLKASGHKTSDICQIVGIKSQNQVNRWKRRYKNDYTTFGIAVLLFAAFNAIGKSFVEEAESKMLFSILL